MTRSAPGAPTRAGRISRRGDPRPVEQAGRTTAVARRRRVALMENRARMVASADTRPWLFADGAKLPPRHGSRCARIAAAMIRPLKRQLQLNRITRLRYFVPLKSQLLFNQARYRGLRRFSVLFGKTRGWWPSK